MGDADTSCSPTLQAKWLLVASTGDAGRKAGSEGRKEPVCQGGRGEG